jgi:hypothetical protein
MQMLPINELKDQWHRLGLALDRRRALRRLNRDLAEFTNKDLADVLARVGIRRSDLFTGFSGNLRHRRLMGHMLVRFGIDRETACQHYWRNLVQAERACAHCSNADKCERWLSWGRTNNAPNVFCRNAGLFTQIRLNLDRLTRASPRTYGLESGLASAEAAHIAEAWSRLHQIEAQPFWLRKLDSLG